MDIDYYQEGKNCAIRGGSYQDNPFIGKYNPKNEGLIWLRGFKDFKTPDPNCFRCYGTGKLRTDIGNYGVIIDFDCMCNSVSGKI